MTKVYLPGPIEYIPQGVVAPKADEQVAFDALDGVNDVMPFLAAIHDHLRFMEDMHREGDEHQTANETRLASRHILAAMELLTPGTLRKIRVAVDEENKRILERVEASRIDRMMHL